MVKDLITKIAAGSKFVAQSGQTFEERVKSIYGVTVMISERSFASAEQTAGIQQVNPALARRIT